jgi:hypothetical protein
MRNESALKKVVRVETWPEAGFKIERINIGKTDHGTRGSGTQIMQMHADP